MHEGEHQKSKRQIKHLRIIVFFVVGLLLETIAFFVGYADNIPFVFKLVSPDYSNAKEGLRTLEENLEINKGNRGFDEIGRLILRKLILENPPEQLVGVEVIKISREPAFAFSAKRVGVRTPIAVELSNGQKLKWNFESLASQVSDLKSKNIFWFAVVIFCLGVLIQVINFVTDKRDST